MNLLIIYIDFMIMLFYFDSVGGVLLSLLLNKYFRFFIYEFSLLEIILIFLGIPSLIILYQCEKNFLTNISLKISGQI